jgi:hypothetical protein
LQVLGAVAEDDRGQASPEPSTSSTQRELSGPIDASEGTKDVQAVLTPMRNDRAGIKKEEEKEKEKEEFDGGVRHLQSELEAETLGETEAEAGAGAGGHEGVEISTSTTPRVSLSDHAAFLSYMMTCSLKMQDGQDLLRNLPLPYANKLPNGFQMSTIQV